MFWTIVAAILFVMFLPYIIAVVFWIAGSIIAIAGYFIAAVVAIGIAYGVWELLVVLGIGVTSVDWTGGGGLFSLLSVVFFICAVVAWKFFKIEAPSILVKEFSRAFRWLEPYDLGRYVRHHYSFTVGDAGKIIKKDNQIEWMKKISKTEQTARDLGLKNRRRLEELQQEGLRASLIAQLPEKDAA